MLLTRAAIAGVVVAVFCLLATGAVWWSSDRDQQEIRAPEPEVTATDVLRTWDAQRAAAWASGDVQALRSLYVRGSRTGRRDTAMLERYVDRGLAVEGMSTQLLSVHEVRRDDARWVLDVSDRLHAGTVVGPGVRRSLPRDKVDRRRLTLRRDDTNWRMVSAVSLPAREAQRSGGQTG